MAEKKIQKNDEDEKEAKEGELNVDVLDILDNAFDDQGFGDEDSDHPVEIKPHSDDEVEEEDADAEWNSYDDKDTY